MANNIQLMEHQINKFGAVEVLDVLLRDVTSKEPILFLDTLKITTLNQEGSVKTIQGGIGNVDLIEYDYGRQVTMEIQDALASMSSLAVMWGGDLLTGDETDNVMAILNITTGEEGILNLPTEITVAEGTTIHAFNTGGTEHEKVVVKFDADTSTYSAKDTSAGVDLLVFVEGKPDTKAVQLTINNLSLPPTVELIGKTFFINQMTGKSMEYQLRVPMFKVNMGGGLTMEAGGDAAVFDFNGKALQHPVTKELFVLTSTGKEYAKR